MVLDELAVINEIFTEIEYLLNASAEFAGVFEVIDSPDLTAVQPDSRPLN